MFEVLSVLTDRQQGVFAEFRLNTAVPRRSIDVNLTHPALLRSQPPCPNSKPATPSPKESPSRTPLPPPPPTYSISHPRPPSYVPYDPSSNDITTCGIPIPYNASSEWASKKVVLFAVPGAFTPGCSVKHLPGYIENLKEFEGKNVDVVAVLAFNDVRTSRDTRPIPLAVPCSHLSDSCSS